MTALLKQNHASWEDEPSRPVFFMHIAKTAGSYLNERFIDALGTDAVQTHIENRIGSGADIEDALAKGTKVFSGHTMLGLWDDMANNLSTDFRLVTLVREPIAHLASHIQWLDHYNRPDARSGYRGLDEQHQRVIDMIGAIDINNAGQLDHFLTGLSGTSMRLLDNCQSRYFFMSGRRDAESSRPLSLLDRKVILRGIARFDFIGRQDRLDRDISEISSAIGVKLTCGASRVNVAKSTRRIDLKNPLIRQVLGKRTLVDQWLWRHLDRK